MRKSRSNLFFALLFVGSCAQEPLVDDRDKLSISRVNETEQSGIAGEHVLFEYLIENTSSTVLEHTCIFAQNRNIDSSSSEQVKVITNLLPGEQTLFSFSGKRRYDRASHFDPADNEVFALDMGGWRSRRLLDCQDGCGTLVGAVSLGKIEASKVYSSASNICVYSNSSDNLQCAGNLTPDGPIEYLQAEPDVFFGSDFERNSTIVDVSVSDQVACALLANGNVYCWGDTIFGQVRNPLQIDSNLPAYHEYKNVVFGSGLLEGQYSSIAVSNYLTCFGTDSEVFCQGTTDNGFIGRSKTCQSYYSDREVWASCMVPEEAPNSAFSRLSQPRRALSTKQKIVDIELAPPVLCVLYDSGELSCGVLSANTERSDYSEEISEIGVSKIASSTQLICIWSEGTNSLSCFDTNTEEMFSPVKIGIEDEELLDFTVSENTVCAMSSNKHWCWRIHNSEALEYSLGSDLQKSTVALRLNINRVSFNICGKFGSEISCQPVSPPGEKLDVVPTSRYSPYRYLETWSPPRAYEDCY